MFKDWKNTILRGWNFMRILRFVLSVIVIIEAVKNYDTLFGVIGSVLLLQSIFNVGCCSNGACYTGNIDNDTENKEIVFEEIKKK